MYLLGFGYIRSNEFIWIKSLTQSLASCEYYSELITIIIVNKNANGYTSGTVMILEATLS